MGEMKIAYKISVGKPEMERNVLYNWAHTATVCIIEIKV
jgi:hypothetical protein